MTIFDEFAAPPWAIATCPACRGSGFNRAGNPCRICDSKQKAAGGIQSSSFLISAHDCGVMWVAKDRSSAGHLTLEEIHSRTKHQAMSAPPDATLSGVIRQVDEAFGSGYAKEHPEVALGCLAIEKLSKALNTTAVL